MERSYFRLVKEAFASDADRSLAALDVQVPRGGKRNREWQTVLCPNCSDSDGSASISVETGFLNCHQCSREMDLFEWWKEKHSFADDYRACLNIGERLGVEKPERKKKSKGREAQRMNPERLQRSIQNLMDSSEAEWARKHFQERGLWDPQLLAECGVGFLDGCITFAQFHPNGDLRERYRKYHPLHPKRKWEWSRGDGGPIGFWPFIELPAGAQLLLCEGEMDTLAAIKLMRLRKREVPIYPFTWTGGASAPVASRLMPDDWPRRTVHLCYDNDTFQGPDLKKHRAPGAEGNKKFKEMVRRRANLLSGVANVFAANNCEVHLLHVNLDPIDNFGADLRDWATQGGRFDDLPSYKLSEMVDPELDPTEITYAQLGNHLGEFVVMRGSVNAVGEQSLLIPKQITIDCPMGSKPCCGVCGVTRRFVDQQIDLNNYIPELLRACTTKDPEAFLIRTLIGKPGACNECALEIDESYQGAHWSAQPSGDDESVGTESIPIVSTEVPSLSGDVMITGYVHPVANTVGIFATKLEQLDKPVFDLDAYHNDLQMACPWASTDPDILWKHVNDMIHDYTHNVTNIYGRPEIHLSTMLVAHSVLRYQIDGHTFRGWLDACVFGGTRLGKSETIKNLFAHWQLGQHYTCMDNFSRAGLTVGGAQSGMQMQPGLFPKNHGKMIFFDEFHHMSSGPSDKNVMVHLQSARDEGVVSAVKVYGNAKLQAAVRLITAGNWSNRKRQHFQYACQHLLPLYGVSESLGRMDFAWVVDGNANMTREEVDHVWTSELSRSLILRAWAMEPHMIHIDPEGVTLAAQVAKEWDEVYAHEELPLHTGAEKYHSIIRIANAFACLCYSHPAGRPRECLTRVVHIKMAIEWLIRCFENLQYDLFSQRVVKSKTVTQPFWVEGMLTCALDLSDPDQAAVMLSQMSEAMSIQELAALVIGNGMLEEQKNFYRWIGQMQRCSALQKSTSHGSYRVPYMPTEGCARILKRLVVLATEDPESYVQRFNILYKWWDSPEGRSKIEGIAKDPDGIQPLDIPFGDDSDEYGVPF